MARVGTEVHCCTCTCRACRRALTAHLVHAGSATFGCMVTAPQMVFAPHGTLTINLDKQCRTIGQIQERVHGRTGIPPERQRLMYGGK